MLNSEKAAAAGITVNVDRVPSHGYWDNIWLKKPICASAWSGRPTEDQMFPTAFAKGTAWNESHWANENVDKLLLAARSELDGTERRDMHHEMQQIVSTEPSPASRPPSGNCRDRASSPS